MLRSPKRSGPRPNPRQGDPVSVKTKLAETLSSNAFFVGSRDQSWFSWLNGLIHQSVHSLTRNPKSREQKLLVARNPQHAGRVPWLPLPAGHGTLWRPTLPTSERKGPRLALPAQRCPKRRRKLRRHPATRPGP